MKRTYVVYASTVNDDPIEYEKSYMRDVFSNFLGLTQDPYNPIILRKRGTGVSCIVRYEFANLDESSYNELQEYKDSENDYGHAEKLEAAMSNTEVLLDAGYDEDILFDYGSISNVYEKFILPNLRKYFPESDGYQIKKSKSGGVYGFNSYLQITVTKL